MSSQVRLREAVERLVQFYDETGRKDEATQRRQELAKLQFEHFRAGLGRQYLWPLLWGWPR
jgi:hypothetical protein